MAGRAIGYSCMGNDIVAEKGGSGHCAEYTCVYFTPGRPAQVVTYQGHSVTSVGGGVGGVAVTLADRRGVVGCME